MKLPPVKYDVVMLQGGLDEVTPTLSLPPGVARRAMNFECSINGGYSRIAGYERFDGHTSPSAPHYSHLIGAITGVAVGDTVTGSVTGATGLVIAISADGLIVTRETLLFAGGEDVLLGGVSQGTLTQVDETVADGLQDAQYQLLVADEYRKDIAAVPGSGAVLGVIYYNDTVYAFRANAAGTGVDLYASLAAGWTLISLGFELLFSLGITAPAEGITLTGDVSGATAVLSRVATESGAWGTTAAGRFILSSVTGTFQAGETVNTGLATVAGPATPITLLPGGRYEMVVGNFGGGTANYRVYGCDGVNRAFEFDGTVFVPIATGMPVDTPEHIAVHKQHLFVSFGSSLQFSSLGEPYRFQALLGAGELAMSGPLTALLVLPGDQSSGALGVYTRNDTSVLYGSSATDFKLSTFNTGTGAIPFSGQTLDQAYVFDDRGLISLGTAINFGNFVSGSLTMNMRKFVQKNRNLVSASMINREKAQYRVFFSNGDGLYATMVNGKFVGAMPVRFPHPVTCCCSGETLSGGEVSYFGSTDGFVYMLDIGASFDGQDIPANVTLVYNSTGSPRVLKRYRKAALEMTGDAYAEFALGYALGYRSTEYGQANDGGYNNDFRSSFFDNASWDTAIYDLSDVHPAEIALTGAAENIAVYISSVSNLFKQFTVNSLIFHYTPRRGLR